MRIGIGIGMRIGIGTYQFLYSRSLTISSVSACVSVLHRYLIGIVGIGIIGIRIGILAVSISHRGGCLKYLGLVGWLAEVV